jgi:uncharacterized membrane protein (Fun14 family)
VFGGVVVVDDGLELGVASGVVSEVVSGVVGGVPVWPSWLGELGVGGVVGFGVALLLRLFFVVFLLVVGFVFVAVQVMVWLGWVSVNWDAVGVVLGGVDWGGVWGGFWGVLGGGVVFGAGFSGGFLLGWFGRR